MTERLTDIFANIFSADAPMTPDRADGLIASIAQSYDFAMPFTLGESVWGHPIHGLRIGSDDAGGVISPSLLYVGAHHGMEWITSSLLLRFAHEYCFSIAHNGRNYGMQTRLLSSMRTIFIIPMLNPDGVSLSIDGIRPEHPMYQSIISINQGSSDTSRWQANGRGVDLNHNYDAGFLEYKTVERERGISGPAPTKFSGEFPLSEPETSALVRLIDRIDPRCCLTLHSQGEELYYTSGGRPPRGGEAFASYAASVTGYKKELPSGTAAYGGMTDWFVAAHDRPSLTIECGHGVNPLPHSDGNEIYRKLRRLLFCAPETV